MLSRHRVSGSGENYFDNPSSGCPQTIHSQLKNSGFLYSRESHKWPNVGRYKVDVSSFESLALPELEVKEDTDLFIIDEVGKMELFSASFFPAVLRVLESNIPLLATVPVPKSGRDIPGVARLKNHPGATIYTLNTSNRDAMKEQIYSNLVDLLQNH
ncbi:nucleoside-triphosphatase THEP1-like isoform X4 [Salvia splendens]|uniref:nucleoside-triphosphatase THEP1-like isoform X4 n=1 Tax=Salvia splendens TaxID=180675 RepID=UPI001C2531F7|nr:nucleoside-triphosphatase THEP1-like isoform X4 [Salvia splendens]